MSAPDVEPVGPECGECDGTGVCPGCLGERRDRDGDCTVCDGDSECPTCGGSGNDWSHQ